VFGQASGRDTFRQYDWDQVYENIRSLNIFLENVQGSETLDAATKEQLMGEAYFLRAYFYHNLMMLFGGVPLVEEVFELGQDPENLRIPRSTFEETIEFIVADLDRAADRLSRLGRQPGHATQGAAFALKSRVLLHAASDLFEENPLGSELVAYTSGSQQDRWQRAKNAAQAVIDLGEYDLVPAPTPDDYHQLFVNGGGGEAIWARHFNGDTGSPYDGQHDISLWSSPNGYNSWSGDTPTQEHVDAYEMADGSEFSWDNPEYAENPYENRDPRFEANIMYNGMDWRERPGGLRELDPEGVIQTGWYEVPGQEDLQPGLDTREGPNEPWNGTRTGYQVKKFVDRNVEPADEQSHNPWIFLRYAEILLNYAEASAELGEDEDARWALNQVRSRVGMPDVSTSGEELIERIRHERKIELAFEERRFFDIRRWMIAPDIYSEPARGIQVTGRLDEDGELLHVDGEAHRYDFEYEIIEVENREWRERTYFLPIPRGEMEANPELEQNPGY